MDLNNRSIGHPLRRTLAPREFQTLQLLAEEDLTYAEAALRMGIRLTTVKDHMRNVRS